MGIFEALSRVTSGRLVIPPVPVGRTIVLYDEEEDAEDIPDERRGASAGLGLFIEYVDAKGQVSARRIAVKRYDSGRRLVHGWCFERSAPRAFKLDRIASAACPVTGEVFSSAELLAMLKGGQVIDGRLRPVMAILVFMMRCDGHQHWAEREALEQAATSFALRFDGDDETVHQALRLANTLVPDSHDFLSAVKWLAARDEAQALARFVLTNTRVMIEADGRIADEEIQFATELRDALKAIADGAPPV